MRTASEMKWVDIPDTKGAQQSVAWGNAEKGPHGSFAKFAGGTEIPLHTHTAAGRTVVITGTMVEGVEGQPPKELGPRLLLFHSRRPETHHGLQGGRRVRDLHRLVRRFRP